MAQTTSLYDVLQVDQSSTLDEIKLAFKRRALQVHPDKGGSKEAFHLVYEALETLADPAARKKYDNGLATGKSGNSAQPKCQTGRKKTAKKRGRSAASEAHPKPEKAERPKPKAARGQTRPESKAPQALQSKQTKLLIRIRDLLKQLPRDVRNDVFTKQFSQKQRLILEKWMVEGSSATQGCSESRVQTVDKTDKTAMRPEDPKTCVAPCKLEPDVPDRSCSALAVPASASSSVKEDVPRTRRSKISSKKQMRDKKTKSESNKRVRSMCGAVCKESGYSDVACYRARIRFDSFEMYTRRCNLQTALEYLVILTSVKQMMQEMTRSSSIHASFEERLHKALSLSTKRHKTELNLRFVVLQASGYLVGSGFPIRTPKVRSVEELGQLRRLLEPFRQYATCRGRQNLFWQYSPVHIQDAWERFQTAVAKAWEIAGVDSAAFLQKIRAVNAANAEDRNRHLQAWERHGMGMQDKNKHRPKRWRDKNSTGRLECSERRKMAMEDRHEHRPKRLRVPVHLRVPDDIVANNLLTLKKFLLQWDRLLKRQERIAAAKMRFETLKKQKKDREEQRRLKVMNQKKLQEKERLRREALRRRMRSDLTMNDILGPHRAAANCESAACAGENQRQYAFVCFIQGNLDRGLPLRLVFATFTYISQTVKHTQ